jgi:hypothetical protein
MIINNTGNRNTYGMEIIGKRSSNNTVINNTFVNNIGGDYICDRFSNGLGSNNYGGVNYGVTEIGCLWLAAINPGSLPLQCTTELAPNVYTMTQDYAYDAGTSCFTIITNSTTINCNGHTVLAINGGTFVNVFNSKYASTIENCNLKGFTTPIVSHNSSLDIINDTIIINSTGLSASTAVANITSAQSFTMEGSMFRTQYTGLLLNNASEGRISGNNVTATTGYVLKNVTGMQVINNTATAGVGILLSNSTSDTLQQNNFYGSSIGLLCTGSSTNRFNDNDQGQNVCSSQNNCKWISMSSLTCP